MRIFTTKIFILTSLFVSSLAIAQYVTPAVMAQDFSVSILKLDPNIVAAKTDFTIVYRVINNTDSVMSVRVEFKTDIEPNFKTHNLSSHGTVVDTLTGYWKSSGDKTIEIKAFRKIGELRTLTPDGRWTYIPRYDRPVITKTTLRVYGGKIPPPSRPIFTDISPNEPAGTSKGGPIASGVIGALAGNEGLLYAVSKTAKVWKMVNGGRWEQLTNSPVNAFCIAVDPSSPSHVVVGEREDDYGNNNNRLGSVNKSGLWESHDAGRSWTFIFDPFFRTDGQAIRAVTFARTTRTLFIATNNGVARKPYTTSPISTDANFEIPPSSAIGAITALAVSETKIWARTADTLLVSTDDGRTWKSIPIPKHGSQLATDFPPPYQRLELVNDRSDDLSLAAFDGIAFVMCKPNIKDANGSAILIFDLNSQKWKGQILDVGNGLGLGGRRFLKTFILDCPNMKSVIGERLQLFVSSAQDFQQARAVNKDGTIQWDRPIRTSGSDNKSHIHADIWDFTMTHDRCTFGRNIAWFATDGGVYQSTPNSTDRINQLVWSTRSEGLHTHNIHTLSVIPAGKGHPTLIAYSTADNSAWWRGIDSNWHNDGGKLGDADWGVADGNLPFAIFWRLGSPAIMTDFTSGYRAEIRLNLGMDLQGPTQFQLIQTLKEESSSSRSMDAVMLTELPLKGDNNKAITLFAEGSHPVIGKAIIRNKKFNENPDAVGSRFRDWRVEVHSLPESTTRFWISGGHQKPVYYIWASSSNNCLSGLYEVGGSKQKCVINAEIVSEDSTYGPLFVNPYNPRQLFVVTKKPTPKIQMSVDGGQTFCPLPLLTMLVTGSGRFPLTGYSPGRGAGITGGTFHGALQGVGMPSHFAFNRDNHGEVVIASPYTGVFYATLASQLANLKCEEPAWKDITPPPPLSVSYTSSVGIETGVAYAATEGGGLFRVIGPGTALSASYFDPVARLSSSGHIATLRGAGGKGIAWMHVLLRVTKLPTQEFMGIADIRTDEDGKLILPFQLPPGNYTVDIDLPSDGTFASYKTAIVIAVR